MIRIVPVGLAVVALVFGVAACGDGGGGYGGSTTQGATPVETPSSTPTAAADGAALFADNCAGCHGADGSGSSGPDVRGENDVQRIVTQVENGGGSMPAFSGRLSPEQIDAVAQHVANQLR